MNQLVLYTLRVMEWERQVSRIPLVHVLARCSSAPKLLSAIAAQSISSQQWNKAIYTSAWLLSSGHTLPPIQLLCIFVESQQAVLGTRPHLQRRAPQTVKLSKAFGMYLWFSSIFKSAFLRKFIWQCLGMTEKPISCLHVKAKWGWDPKAISAGVLGRASAQQGVYETEPGGVKKCRARPWRLEIPLRLQAVIAKKGKGMVFFPFIPGLLLDTKMRTWLYRKPCLLVIISCACFCFYSLPSGVSKLCQNLAFSSSPPRCNWAVTPAHQRDHKGPEGGRVGHHCLSRAPAVWRGNSGS